MEKKEICIVLPTYNEEVNIKKIYEELSTICNKLVNYKFNFLVIDNDSTDNTQNLLRDIAKSNKNFRVIINNRNYGHVRSPYWGILQSVGDATIYMASDFQDPPNKIPELLNEWSKGSQIVLGVKNKSKSNFIFHKIRKLYYSMLTGLSKTPPIENSTGFGIYDSSVIKKINENREPYPFFRGLITELGFKIKQIEFTQEKRSAGITKNNFFTLIDYGLLGIISQSTLPLRIITLVGFFISVFSLALGIIYLVLKLIYWEFFIAGQAPLLILILLLFGFLFAAIGIIGEYLSYITIRIKNLPIVNEKERINFDKDNSNT